MTSEDISQAPFLKEINGNCSGIIWITKNNLENSPYFHDFDYLLDGLLVQSLKNDNINSKNKNLFFSKQFGTPFFIGQFSSQRFSSDNVKEIIKIALSDPEKKTDILVFSDDLSDGYKDDFAKIEKLFGELNFKFV